MVRLTYDVENSVVKTKLRTSKEKERTVVITKIINQN